MGKGATSSAKIRNHSHSFHSGTFGFERSCIMRARAIMLYQWQLEKFSCMVLLRNAYTTLTPPSSEQRIGLRCALGDHALNIRNLQRKRVVLYFIEGHHQRKKKRIVKRRLMTHLGNIRGCSLFSHLE